MKLRMISEDEKKIQYNAEVIEKVINTTEHKQTSILFGLAEASEEVPFEQRN